ncbi:hypothetical protein PCASD_09420 [Puccinia coronata f. sp. avenae]|uniref:Uncharacterized protein n=1 Tax=Puccinia coronata f. sp. avenae TaxID=200324 RepID=A0A2N5UHQ5_9BASI|nr:hypothetical protein PCASD_09420 [Puccinia coronata f. sp. avenae]
MSHPLVSSPSSTYNDITINFDQLPNAEPVHLHLHTPTPTLTVELGFHPIHLLKFTLLLLAFLVIPLLSTNSSFPRPLGSSSRKLSGKNAHPRRPRRHTRCQLPATYQPPQSVVDAPFIPLPTRRHFRISHIGNQARRPAGTVVYTNQSSSDSDDYCSEDALTPEAPQQFRLVFGKRIRGEEQEFRGPSAMKGSRLANRSPHPPSLSSSPSSPSSNTCDTPLALHEHHHHVQSSLFKPDSVEQQSRSLPQKKAISFAATTQACTHRISTQIDSSISFLSCQLK